MLARPTGDLSQSSGERRTNPSEGDELRRSAGSGMLIGDPLVERSNASSTNSELWGAEDSSFSAQKEAAYS